ncbi:hypothetical protein [Hymenobacter wooponensis]|uniref:Uncharacterized protein n=1 Tax=Hymenobacter wooponensis TaxID=1525360 RepID=A0A4Z0MVG7_9BACT|nr:hypothetical protein [Hymenobacter wooponensis]TGD83125.1 hypothetical protein EU557_04920 [Hymenobacter wooponensis]
MPVALPLDASDEDILEAVRIWVKLLELERYEEAFQYTFQDPYYEWTPELMRDVIYGYGFPEYEADSEVYKVTSMEEAVTDGNNPYAEIDFHMPRKHKVENVLIVAEIWFSLPLNGKWSDVTATFNVLYMPTSVSLELQEIHVF